MKHPIWGDLRSETEKEAERRALAAELRQKMEALWKSSRVVNPRRVSRYVKPMTHGATHGYHDEIYGD